MSSDKDEQSESVTLQAGADASDTSPDISLSSQTTLRYADVEPQHSQSLNKSYESSSSIETLEEPTVHSGMDENLLQHLTLTPDVGQPCTTTGSVDSDTDSAGSHEVIAESAGISRPESLSLSRSTSERGDNETAAGAGPNLTSDLTQFGQTTTDSKVSSSTQPVSIAAHSSRPEVEPSGVEGGSLSQSLPQGTITRKGDLIQFVACDLQEKIKQSSPISQPDAGSSSSRRSSIRSYASASSSTSFATSSGLSQSPCSSGFQQSPEDIPPIDATAVIELENHASRVADSLDLMMGNIRNNLHKMSAITIGCQDAYKRSVDITCDSVDGSIKTMYALMAKCEELNASMAPVQQLANQIKEIKRILDLFESQLTDK